MSQKQRDEGSERSSTESCGGGEPGPLPAALDGVLIWFFHGGGVEEGRLAPGQSLIAGRHPPSDVCIPDRGVSRQHARFTLEDGHVIVEDLGSHNGTSVDGNRIHKATLLVNGEAMLGTVIAQVIARGPVGRPLVDREEDFFRALDTEITRAQRYGRSLAVLALCASEAEAARGPGGSWVMRLAASLSPFQRVRLHNKDTALILLPEATREEAMQTARTLVPSPDQMEPPRRVGVAVYPEDATSAYKLIDEARDAVCRATPESPVGSALAVRRPAGDVVAGDVPIIGHTTKKLYDEARKAAIARSVLILGESGSGKEVVARFLHDNGPRHDKPFIVINCGALTDSLLGSELFGHEKGAFTGAARTRKGAFEEANGGTLFLDEIGELKLEAQAALLRALDEQKIMRVGSTQQIKVNVSVIAATNRDLDTMVREGRFRGDLYFRLNVISLKVPPLHERIDEIEPLARLLLARAAKESKQTNKDGSLRVRGVSPEAMALLRAHRWPGNVRELRNALERAAILAEGGVITPEDLPSTVQAAQPATAPSASAAGVPIAISPPADTKDPPSPPGLRADLRATEAKQIEAALRQANGNLTEAAKLLGISDRTLRRKRRALGIPGRKR